MYYTRTLEHWFKEASQQFSVLLLTGARQVGKTTFLKHVSEAERTYVTLDDPMVLALAKKDPDLFMQRFPPPVLIDEIQYAPELLPHIKIAVDRQPSPNLFWLTGSQQFQMMKGVSESLAGRVGILQLLGFSHREMLGRGETSRPFLPTPTENGAIEPLDLMDLYRLIWRGSFPDIALNLQKDRDLFYSSYIQTYLQRDIRDLARVGDEMAFLRFLRAAAARTGQLLNMADLARDADVAFNTAKSWLSILAAADIVFLLEPYHTNLTKRMVKAPKIYFMDTGLCAYLTQWSTPETLEAGAMSGTILETWIIAELFKSYRHNGRQAPFFYYRDKDKKEIDLLIMQDGVLYPLECKKTASPSKNDIRHFSVLQNLKMPIGPGGIICLTRQSLPIGPSVRSVPVASL